MDGLLDNYFICRRDDREITAAQEQHMVGFPYSSEISESKSRSATPSTKRSRRTVEKRVVVIPISDVDGSGLKGEGAPPSDSWAWRKYGQKPIKGSPYPRGYYRCSSAKGCPARKQVERSRVDPNMLVVTYACEHNHPWQAPRNTSSSAGAAVAPPPSNAPQTRQPVEEAPALLASLLDEKFSDLPDESLLSDDFCWFADIQTSPPKETVMDSPNSLGLEQDAALMFPMREEDELLFADLGELPECSVGFRFGSWERDDQFFSTAPWCGTIG